ncbi:MAG: NADH-quinone oxidoreductase subunit H [Candidatus Heimdallarchaeota archaeon]|nr:MAG: NADH-quinone oxidoreductase subunit H [Candidatus Heimdallarchaeota archaeon]
MGFGLYEWLVDGYEINLFGYRIPWPGIIPLVSDWKLIPEDQVGPIRSFILDSLEMTTILVFLIVNTILLILLERKVASGRAWTARGPVFIDLNWGHFFSWPFGKRTWKIGLLQNVAEFLKFFSKEDIVPEKADKFPFNIGFFAFVVAPPFILGALLPLGTISVIANPAVGFLLIFALFSLYPVGVLITGWSSNNKYSLLGGFRSAAQMISYEIPLMLSVTAVVLATNSFSLIDIAEQQTLTLGGLPFAILMPIGFIVFMASLAAETERIPFDIPEAEAELVMGWRTELTGFRYMMSMATEYFILLIGAFIGVFLFWGGAYLPFGFLKETIETIHLLAFLIITVKLWIFIFLYIWIRASLPRVRIDQLLDIGWKRLIPLAILNIIFVIIVIVNNPQLFGVI